MKRVKQFRLSERAIEILRVKAAQSNMCHTAALELLLRIGALHDDSIRDILEMYQIEVDVTARAIRKIY